MPQVPILSPKEVIKVFSHFGWKVARQRGSHIILTKQGHITTLSIPNHSEVARGTLRSLISRSGINADEFIRKL